MRATKSLIALLSSLLFGCVSPIFATGIYDPKQAIPERFLRDYPSGTQVRDISSIQRVLERKRDSLARLYAQYIMSGVRKQGRIDLVIAINNAGVVDAIGILQNDLNAPVFEKKLLLAIGLINFGPAPGDGLFVFSYPVTFDIAPGG